MTVSPLGRKSEFSSATLVNTKLRQNVINRSLSYRNCRVPTKSRCVTELEINIFKSGKCIPSHHFLMLILVRAISGSSLFHFSTVRPNIIYGFGVFSMDFWITTRQMTTRGKSIEYCTTVIIRANPDRELA